MSKNIDELSILFLVLFSLHFVVISPLKSVAQEEPETTFEKEEIRKQINESVRPEIRNMEAFLKDEKGTLVEIDSIHDLLKQVERKRLNQLKKNGHSGTKQPASLTRLDALKLRMRGYTRGKIEQLRKRKGINPVSLMLKPPMALTPSEKLTLSESVVIAEVLEKKNKLKPKDGYRSSVVLGVDEVLVGEVPSDRIILRRLSGKSKDGRYVTISHDFKGAVGSKHIFYLSNTKYRYRVKYPTQSHSKSSGTVSGKTDSERKYVRTYTASQTKEIGSSIIGNLRSIGSKLESTIDR